MYIVCDKNYVEDEFRFVFICPLQVLNQSFMCVCQCDDPHASF